MMLESILGALLVSTAVVSAQSPRDFYTGCGETKACLGEPLGCLDDQTCFVASSYVKRGSEYDFEIFAEYEGVDDGQSWIATAFSRDVRMWNDTVLFCGPPSPNSAQLYWNIKEFSMPVGEENMILGRITQNGEIVSAEGAMYCAVTRVEKLVFITPEHVSQPSQEETNDLGAEPFYWMLAAGGWLPDDGADEHVIFGLSETAIDFSGLIVETSTAAGTTAAGTTAAGTTATAGTTGAGTTATAGTTGAGTTVAGTTAAGTTAAGTTAAGTTADPGHPGSAMANGPAMMALFVSVIFQLVFLLY